MRWDDLQILRSIDDMEQSGQYLGNGLNLLDQLARQAGVPPHESKRELAIELALAYDKGYLTWTDRSDRWVTRSSPTSDANTWLQSFDDIKLTLDGRDRARGRVIQAALPDRDEDDGRLITGLTMEEIARSIGDTYTSTSFLGTSVTRDCQKTRSFRPSAATSGCTSSRSCPHYTMAVPRLAGRCGSSSADGSTAASTRLHHRMCENASLHCWSSRDGMSATVASLSAKGSSLSLGRLRHSAEMHGWPRSTRTSVR